jgi:hypothetical protein
LLPWILVIALVGVLSIRSFIAFWWITLPCLATIAMYSLVLVEGRYIAPFIALLVFTLTAAADTGALNVARIGAGVLVLALVGISQMNIARHPSPAASEAVAQALGELGLRSGDSVAVVEDGLRHYWARPARVRIMAELPSAEQYIESSPQRRTAALSAIEKAGARWVVSSKTLPDAPPYSWRNVPGTNYFVMAQGNAQ